uniref:CAZy families GH25 protein n=1 Tax=uncultured Butyrivibrio sp. TaxID=370801 RepID=A0A060C2W8_9FIRM|nr:CAZy families GH25 protein [uncultured Butyrivibrio sp.]
MQALGVTWSSSDSSVASVDSNGNVAAVNWGQATITAHYPDGTSANCLVNVAFKGIDVSQWQTSVDWTAVKNSGVEFAMIRTGYGSEYWSKQTDSKFETYYNGAVQRRIKGRRLPLQLCHHCTPWRSRRRSSVFTS